MSMREAIAMTTKRRVLAHVILVVEKDPLSRDRISSFLREAGYIVLAVSDEKVALEVVQNNVLSLVLLDLRPLTPDIIDFCHTLQDATQATPAPVLMLVEQADEIPQIESTSIHVDDYLQKPLRWEELRACLRILLHDETRTRHRSNKVYRRPEKSAVSEQESLLVVDDLSIDLAHRTIVRQNQVVKLGSSLVFDLLVYLVRHRGVVLSRDHLLEQVWGYPSEELKSSTTRTVSVHMHWLREVLGENPHDPCLIQTVRGVGYCFKA
jgi:DNA-binding response OmpR family regulator